MKRFYLSIISVLTGLILNAQVSDLIISEYVEGTGYNRAIELYNGTGNSINLSNYRLERDLNGNNTFTYYYNLSGTLENGKTLVICNPNSVDTDFKAKANAFHQIITEFTGDDQIRLIKNGVEIDHFGIPGAVNFAQNVTFVRKETVLSPVVGDQDPRTNGEWQQYSIDNYSNLGSHTIKYVQEEPINLESVIKCDASGNIGIGTANTFGYKLAVNGTIGAKEVKVEITSPWPDFVFDINYKLRTLYEVEQFIKLNNHLPEIPSEVEIRDSGIGLGEMNAKLLQKVEELTLYLIEIKKENDNLRSRLEVLESKK